MPIVCKFGGSSLANSEQFHKVKDIIESDDNRRYIIPSAPGKAKNGDQKVTDLLILLYNMAVHKLSSAEVMNMIESRYREILNGIGIEFDLKTELDEILSYIASGKVSKSYVLSRGEYLNGKILSAYLGYDFVDAKDVICFDENGTWDEESSYKALAKMQEEHERAVIPGFYGSTPSGKIVTFSRGGSDLSGAIVARGVNAELYENWTDVSGLLAVDPSVIPHPKKIKNISYQELRELSYSGAKVMHDEAMFPVIEKNIPVVIRNTNAKDDAGSYIMADVPEDAEGEDITGIACRKGFDVINIEKFRMNRDLAFHRKVLSVLEANDIYLEHMPSSIDSISLVIASKYLKNKTDQLIAELQTFTNADRITMDHNIALITIVGRNMKNRIGTSAHVFSALAAANVNIRMIIQGASEMNIIVGVLEEEAEKSIEAIYNASF
ncbi:aspartate kinase [Aedoeadaptatus urinae]|uniref:aspartate kinase n=1 Tax=Aedoeadaptatus urinae TaxID=1871017 RepID=UPI00097D90ED|nr:aspartate kinase [Peptoniphilus urinae]